MKARRWLLRTAARANDALAVAIVRAVGSMWCAYAFAALACISLPDAIHGGRAAIVSWLAQTFLQLVLLSVIMVGQAVLSRAQEKRAAEDHEALQKLIRELHDHLGVGAEAADANG